MLEAKSFGIEISIIIQQVMLRTRKLENETDAIS